MAFLTKLFVAVPTYSLLLVYAGRFDIYAQATERGYAPPLKKIRITSPYGPRIHPVTGRYSFHNGLDISASADTVYAILDGTVTGTGWHRNLGRYIKLDHGSLCTVYGHLSTIAVRRGQALHAGQAMAITGSTGRSTADHLHFAVEYNGQSVDPMQILIELSIRYPYRQAPKNRSP